MRYLRKNLACVNRHDQVENDKAIEVIKGRYLKKMNAKGWYYFESVADQAGGDQFFKYVISFCLIKPNPNSSDDLKAIEKYKAES